MLGPHFEQLAREHVRRIGATLVGAPKMFYRAEHARVILASAAGFTHDLVAEAARRADVHLVGLEAIYTN